jgi:hypothetical protein
MFRYRFVVPTVLACVAVVWVCAVPASAEWTPDTATMIEVEATADGHTTSVAWTFPQGLVINGHFEWTLPSPVDLVADGKTLGRIDQLSLRYDTDPGVSLGFAVTAGNSATQFQVTSSTVPFTPLINTLAFATAAVTVTDNDGTGASATGLFSGSKAYEARYNGPAVVWARLVDPVTCGVDDSMTGSERRPSGTGRQAVPAPVSSVESEFYFTLSAKDQASGTSRFDITGVVPEPATLSLLALGALALIRRRR